MGDGHGVVHSSGEAAPHHWVSLTLTPAHPHPPTLFTPTTLTPPTPTHMHYCSDHEVQFYEMVNFEPYCQLRRLESVPLKLDFWLVTASQSQWCTVMQTLAVCLCVCQFVFLLFLCMQE